MQNTAGSLNAALAVFRETLENVKKITGNVKAVSEDAIQISCTVPRSEKSLRGLYECVSKGLGPAAGANIAGLKGRHYDRGGNPGKKSQRRKE